MAQIREIGGVLGQGNFLDQFARGVRTATEQAEKVGRELQRAAEAKDPLSLAFDSLEVRTTVASPLKYTSKELMGEITAPPNPKGFTRRLKPTIIIESRLFGRKVLAPYGEAGENDWKQFQNNVWLYGIGGILGLYILGVISGYAGAKMQQKKG